MSKRPRLLVLSPRYPYPLIGGDRVRVFHICKELAQHFDITLLCMCDLREEFTAPVPVDAPFARVERIWLPRWRSYLNVLRALPGSLPLQVAYYQLPSFERRVQELLPEHDIVLTHLIRTSGFVMHSPTPRVLEMTDAISMNYERSTGTSSRKRLRTWIYAIEQQRVLRYERAMLESFNLVTLVSEIDRRYLVGDQPATNLIVCSNGVATDRFPFQPRFDAEPVVTFIGNLTTLQNLDACYYFAREVMPALRRVRPWVFRVVGRIRDADSRALSAMEGVQVTGEVPSVPDTVRGARAGVCPMRVGAGIQNKLLEYMALGLPAITSSLSLQALSAQPGRELFVADAPEQYVQHLEKLFADPALSLEMATAARAYVQATHDWSVHLAPMVERMRALAAR
jgi:glycosyltransferase involved in cell wall biosynthesis